MPRHPRPEGSPAGLAAAAAGAPPVAKPRRRVRGAKRTHESGTHAGSPGTDAATSDADANAVIERPDGYHWTDEPGRLEFGPFPTALEAREDMAGARGRHDEDVDALGIAEPVIDVESAHDAPSDDPPEAAT